MTTDESEQSPFSRPGFIASAVLVAVVLVLAVVLLIVNANRGEDAPATAQPPGVEAAPQTPVEAPAVSAGGASVCGLGGEAGPDALRPVTGPEVDVWDYVDVSAYPTSAVYGPGAIDEEGGFRYCFQHSPEGALFAAAYIAASGTGTDIDPVAWAQYYTSPGEHRQEVIEAAEDRTPSESDTRLRLAGFRVLAYDGDSARIDLGFATSTGGQSAKVSFVYNLVWVDGDWKIDMSIEDFVSGSALPDLVGYVAWSE